MEGHLSVTWVCRYVCGSVYPANPTFPLASFLPPFCLPVSLAPAAQGPRTAVALPCGTGDPSAQPLWSEIRGSSLFSTGAYPLLPEEKICSGNVLWTRSGEGRTGLRSPLEPSGSGGLPEHVTCNAS